NPRHLAGLERYALERRPGPHGDALAIGIEREHVERRRRRQAEALSLADGEAREAAVASQLVPRGIDEYACRVARAGVAAFDEAGVIPVGHEADVAALRLLGDRQL